MGRAKRIPLFFFLDSIHSSQLPEQVGLSSDCLLFLLLQLFMCPQPLRISHNVRRAHGKKKTQMTKVDFLLLTGIKVQNRK